MNELDLSTNSLQSHAPEILGNLEALDQCRDLIQQLSIAEYTRQQQPYMTSSIGEHVRHILDVYVALMAEPSANCIDYNFKRRGDAVETSCTIALAELAEARNWVSDFPEEKLSKTVTVRCEVTQQKQSICEMPSFWQRELVFTASHAVHHCALIGVSGRLSQLEVNELLGLAPATASFRRQRNT